MVKCSYICSWLYFLVSLLLFYCKDVCTLVFEEAVGIISIINKLMLIIIIIIITTLIID